MAQSDELTAFYQAYLAWLNAGAPETNVFDTNAHGTNVYGFARGSGLCANLRYFCEHYESHSNDFQIEMAMQFTEAGLSPRFPFNPNPDDFYKEVYKSTCHINPKRVQWVNDHC